MAAVKKVGKQVQTTQSQGSLRTKGNKAIPPAMAGAKKVKLPVPKAPYKMSEFWATLAEQTGASQKEVKRVVEALKAMAKVHLVKNGSGQFTLPGLLKMTAKTKPATKARKGVNPFTGEAITIKAKPARRAVKVRILRKFMTELE